MNQKGGLGSGCVGGGIVLYPCGGLGMKEGVFAFFGVWEVWGRMVIWGVRFTIFWSISPFPSFKDCTSLCYQSKRMNLISFYQIFHFMTKDLWIQIFELVIVDFSFFFLDSFFQHLLITLHHQFHLFSPIFNDHPSSFHRPTHQANNTPPAIPSELPPCCPK